MTVFVEVANVTIAQRIDGPTPGGGDYSEIIYLDDNGDAVDEDVATKCVIRECASDGSLICETLGVLS